MSPAGPRGLVLMDYFPPGLLWRLPLTAPGPAPRRGPGSPLKVDRSGFFLGLSRPTYGIIRVYLRKLERLVNGERKYSKRRLHIARLVNFFRAGYTARS